MTPENAELAKTLGTGIGLLLREQRVALEARIAKLESDLEALKATQLTSVQRQLSRHADHLSKLEDRTRRLETK